MQTKKKPQNYKFVNENYIVYRDLLTVMFFF